jgi:hypothetical protein
MEDDGERVHVWPHPTKQRHEAERAVIKAAKAWKGGWKYPLNPSSDPHDWEIWVAVEALQAAEGET